MDAVSNRKKLLFSLFVFLLVPGWVSAEHGHHADQNNSELIAADSLVNLVLDRNPGIEALLAIEEAAKYQIDPARSLDDPTFSYGFAPKTLDADDGRGLNQNIKLSQKVPWPGTLAAREQEALQESKVAHEDVNALRLRLIALTKSAYAEWYFVNRSLQIHESTSELLEELRAVAETRYAAGRALQQDVLQAEVEQRNLDRHGLQLIRLKTSIQAQINTLLNQNPNTPLPSVADVAIQTPIPTLASLEQRALELHPELKRIDAQVAANTARIDLAEKDFYPDLQFFAGYNSLWNAHDKRPIVGVSINVPFDRSKRKAALSQAKANEHSLKMKLVDQRAQLLGELARAYAETIESSEAIELYEDSLVPLANEYLSAALADYESGAGSFLSVITAEQKKLITEEALERNRANYFSRVADLERWTGNGLDGRVAFSAGVDYEN
ncbi:MAG: TolC family protein [Gammaproteobacteria bacterium]|nr:MAG: TolC family protein [Gammaproteobacteria bacterium]